jgi:hypothetical protein
LTGVACVQAVNELNVKPGYWKDLETDAPFTRKDIIHIQDPMNLSGRNVAEFHHVKTKLTMRDGDTDASDDPLAGLNTSKLGEDTQRILAKLNTEESAKVMHPCSHWLNGEDALGEFCQDIEGVCQRHVCHLMFHGSLAHGSVSLDTV